MWFFFRFIYRISHVCTVYAIDYVLFNMYISSFFFHSMCDFTDSRSTFTLVAFFRPLLLFYQCVKDSLCRKNSRRYWLMCLYGCHKVLLHTAGLFFFWSLIVSLCILTGRQLFARYFCFFKAMSNCPVTYFTDRMPMKQNDRRVLVFARKYNQKLNTS